MTEQKQVIPEGYKQTEIGVLPEDWISGSLGDNTINIGSGRTSTKGSGDYPLFGSTGVIGSCLNGEYEGDAILVARVGANAGKINFVTGKYGVSDNTIIVKFKNSVDIAYFRYQLDRKNLNTLVFGSGQPLITGSQLKEILFPLPPKYEQTAIANALSDVDALISELEKFIAKKQAIKTATMQQLLTGKTRLPPFSLREDGTPKGYKASELGEIPEDWVVCSIGQLCTYQNGIAQESLFNSIDGYKIVSIGNYSQDGKYISTGTYIDRSLKSKIGKFILKKNDLAMILNDKTSVGTIIGRVILIDADDSYVMNQRTMRLTTKPQIESEYLYFLLNADFVHKRIVGSAKPGTQIYINTNDVLSFALPVSENGHSTRRKNQSVLQTLV